MALRADDALGASREAVTDPPLPAYVAAFDAIAADPRSLLVVAEQAGSVVGKLQLTAIPGLSDQGAELALIKAVRVAASLRSQGLGTLLMDWAMDEAHRRGCRKVELMTHLSRTTAQRFYERLGFVKSHVGMRRAL